MSKEYTQESTNDCWYKLPVHGCMSPHKPIKVPDGEYWVAEWSINNNDRKAYWTDELYFNQQIKDYAALVTFNIFYAAKFASLSDLKVSWRQRGTPVLIQPIFVSYKWKNNSLIPKLNK